MEVSKAPRGTQPLLLGVVNTCVKGMCVAKVFFSPKHEVGATGMMVNPRLISRSVDVCMVVCPSPRGLVFITVLKPSFHLPSIFVIFESLPCLL